MSPVDDWLHAQFSVFKFLFWFNSLSAGDVLLVTSADILCKQFGLNQTRKNSFLASGNFCCLLITFANSLNPDQDGQNVFPDLDPPNYLTS